MSNQDTLNIFEVLHSIKTKNRRYYDELTESEQKKYLPVVIMRWLSGMTDQLQIVLINEVVNPYIFPFLTKSDTGQTHVGLLHRLMVCSSVCSPHRYNWPKISAKKQHTLPLTVDVIQRTYGYNKSKAIDALGLLDNDIILSLAVDLGMQPEDIKKLKKELVARH